MKHVYRKVRYLKAAAGVPKGELKSLPLHLALKMEKGGFIEFADDEEVVVTSEQIEQAREKVKEEKQAESTKEFKEKQKTKEAVKAENKGGKKK